MGINHTDGVLQRRNMDGDVVARAENVLQISDVMNGAGVFPAALPKRTGRNRIQSSPAQLRRWQPRHQQRPSR